MKEGWSSLHHEGLLRRKRWVLFVIIISWALSFWIYCYPLTFSLLWSCSLRWVLQERKKSICYWVIQVTTTSSFTKKIETRRLSLWEGAEYDWIFFLVFNHIDSFVTQDLTLGKRCLWGRHVWFENISINIGTWDRIPIYLEEESCRYSYA